MAGHTIRLFAEANQVVRTPLDEIHEKPLFWWRGSDVRIELGLFDNGVALTQADVGTIIVEVKALDSLPVDPSLMRKEYGPGDCDATYTAESWSNGAKQLVVAEFTAAEAALVAGSYRLIVRHEDATGKKITFISGVIKVEEDFSESASITSPPAPSNEYYSKNESDGRYSTFAFLLANHFTQTQVNSLIQALDDDTYSQSEVDTAITNAINAAAVGKEDVWRYSTPVSVATTTGSGNFDLTTLTEWAAPVDTANMAIVRAKAVYSTARANGGTASNVYGTKVVAGGITVADATFTKASETQDSDDSAVIIDSAEMIVPITGTDLAYDLTSVSPASDSPMAQDEVKLEIIGFVKTNLI